MKYLTQSFPLLFTFILLLAFAEEASAFGRKPAPEPKPNPTPAPEPSPVDVIRARWEASQRDGAAWSKYVYDRLPALGPDLLAKVPADIAQFCENYPNLKQADKKNFWVYLLSAMSEFESSHQPETKYTEAFYDQKGNRVVSRGLLQISIESGNAYGCGFKNEEELHDPYKNLDCGLRILNRWLGRDGRLAGKAASSWQGGARYWSVLRKDSTLSKIQAWSQEQRICWAR